MLDDACWQLSRTRHRIAALVAGKDLASCLSAAKGGRERKDCEMERKQSEGSSRGRLGSSGSLSEEETKAGAEHGRNILGL